MNWRADPKRGLWLIPSRGRPNNLARLMAALRQSNCTTDGWVLVNRRELESYQQVALHDGWRLVACDEDSQGAKVREVWPQIGEMDWVGLGGDDQEPITDGWDLRLIAALRGWNLVSCNDNWTIHGDARHPYQRIAGFICFSGPLLRALGYPIFLPEMHHTCLDDAYEYLDTVEPCREILHDVTIEHHHFQNGRAERDQTYGLAYDKYNGNDEHIWQSWRYNGEARRAAQRVLELKGQLGA